MKLVKLCALVGSGAILAMVAVAADDGLPSIPPGKPGLYELRKFSNMAMFIARDLSKTAVQEQQKLSAEAMARSGPVFQICVPQDGAKVLDAAVGINTGCTYSNVVRTEHGFSADVRCTGLSSTHIAIEANTPEHHEVTVNSQPMPNAAVPLIDKYIVNWISSDCGELPPGSLRTPDGKIVTPRKS